MISTRTEKLTPLYDCHVEADARMTPFGGYLLPVTYEGILAEHRAAREGAALFDTSHMGEIMIEGPAAIADLERLLSCRISSLKPGRCRYGLMCRPDGGVLDDLIVYRFGNEAFMLVVNAGTRVRDLEWIRGHTAAETQVKDRSDSTAKIDLQGPDAPRIACALLDPAPNSLSFFSFTRTHFREHELLVSRTGYTGEVGFEFYIDSEAAPRLWNACLRQGAEPSGLGARDTLRLEAGLPLYGHELTEERNAGESGFHFAIDDSKAFIGADAIRKRTPSRVLCGLELDGRRAAREGSAVLDTRGAQVGTVTSGSFAPSVGNAVALAYIDRRAADGHSAFKLDAGRKTIAAERCDTPFYRGGTARQPLQRFLETAPA
ncbi:glycine cleavage system aminomethyltransferase GcvT [Kiritimatiella glycovorans]|uniref:aminomethyltransferase n=1 Tax=Kiritimatiella glycovorans TaxID=1307763 RepID=A0A0G3EFK8_9BACT|nr:glycine cleavage system aminomethyltransferase GcvT [Kiritimatiella glycovorans]AKJ65251.1 Aminomethyltransferase [Kiritimatiella glycovorans]